MKQFRWILLSGLLVAATSVAQAQAPTGSFPSPSGGSSATPSGSGILGSNGASEVGSISNAPGAATTTTTTTTGIAPDSSSSFVPAEDGALGTESDSSLPNTGGEPMIAVLAGLSIAGAAVAMRRKVTA